MFRCFCEIEPRRLGDHHRQCLKKQTTRRHKTQKRDREYRNQEKRIRHEKEVVTIDAKDVICGTVPWDDATLKLKATHICVSDRKHTDSFATETQILT